MHHKTFDAVYISHNAHEILKAEEKRPFERPRHRWEDNIRMNLRKTGWECVDWIHLA
jgi:hypothetical protein